MAELSVSYNQFIKKWILLYNCLGIPRGINFRTADFPWGPWSEEQLIFEPWTDQGYCHFMHTSWSYNNCDEVHDSGREYEWGGEYEAYQIHEFANGNDTTTTIYYTMSTWNPYTVILMKSSLRKPENNASIYDFPSKNNGLPFRVFPNPSMDKIKIYLPAMDKNTRISIFNTIGEKVLGRHLTNKETRIDISALPRGVYFVRVQDEKMAEVTKLIKQ